MVLRSLALVAVLSLLALPTHAEEAAGAPSRFVADIGNEAVLVLSDTGATAEQRESEFRRLLLEGFDVPAIGRIVAGGYWDRAAEGERAEYQRLFEDYVVRIHARRLSRYFVAAIKVGGEQPNGRDTIVSASIEQPNAAPIHVLWRVRKTGERYKILDVTVGGISMVQTQRSEFMSVIQRGGGDLAALFPQLREKIAIAAP